MMKRVFSFFAIAVVSLLFATTLSAREINVVPEPAYVDLEAEGEYMVSPKTTIIVVDEMWAPAERFSEDMTKFWGAERPILWLADVASDIDHQQLMCALWLYRR